MDDGADFTIVEKRDHTGVTFAVSDTLPYRRHLQKKRLPDSVAQLKLRVEFKKPSAAAEWPEAWVLKAVCDFFQLDPSRVQFAGVSGGRPNLA